MAQSEQKSHSKNRDGKMNQTPFPCTYTEQKKKRNNRPPRIFDFKGKTLMISGLLLYDFHSWDIRVYHAKKLIFISIKIE